MLGVYGTLHHCELSREYTAKLYQEEKDWDAIKQVKQHLDFRSF